ncbi:MAG: hypothetical protein LBB82_06025, partial [Treponema sp.]|nr:hypothetical protein [Treponema sp.]
MRNARLLSLFLVSAPFLLAAQTPAENAAIPDRDHFSVSILLEAARGQKPVWRPDWPLRLPPDLFVVDGGVTALRVSIEGADSPAFPPSLELRGGAAPVRFPVFMNGTFFQAASGGGGRRVSGSGFDVEILRSDEEGRPVLARVLLDDYYFVALDYGAAAVEETWYDREGNFLSL